MGSKSTEDQQKTASEQQQPQQPLRSSASTSAFTEESSYALNSRLTVMRSLSMMKVRLINYLNKVDTEDTRFGSCNEFTMGIATKKETSSTNNKNQ